MPPKISGQAVTFEPVPPFELEPTISVEHRPLAELPPTFTTPPAAVAPDADPKEAAGAIKEFEGFWGAADAAFEDKDFNRDALPALEAEGPEQLTFSAVTGWKRASDWVAELAAAAAAEAEPPAPPEDGEEEPSEPEPAVKLCVVNPVGPSDEEVDRLKIIHRKLEEIPEPKPEPEEGQEDAEEGEEQVEEPNPELDDAMAKLQHEASRRIRGFEPNHVEQSMEWLGGLLGMVVSMRESVQKGEYLWESIYPQTADGMPQVSPNGMYCVKLWLHGEWRSVIVDDFLPFGSDGLPLLLRTCRSDKQIELWPLLLAKAALKAFGHKSDGSPLQNAMAYATAITGKSFHMTSTKSMGVSLEKVLMGSCAQGSKKTVALVSPPMLGGSAEVAEVPGIHPRGVHTVCDSRIARYTSASNTNESSSLVRLEATRSEFLTKHMNALVPIQASKGMRETDQESKFLQIAASADWIAETHSVPGVMSSFWVCMPDILLHFGTAIVMNSTLEMEHQSTLNHAWSDTSVPMGKPQPMLVYCESEAASEFTVSLWLPPVSWTAPEPDQEADGDAPPPEPPTEPAVPHTKASLENWDWKLAKARRVGMLDTELVSSASIRVCPGKNLFRFNLDAPLGYVMTISSETSFTAGDMETVLKEAVGLGSVTTTEAPLVAVDTNTANIVMRLNVNATEKSQVAAYIELADPCLEKYVQFSLLDNEKSQSTSYMSLFMPAVTMEATETGYTLMLESKSLHGKPAICSSTATVYVLSDTENVTATLDNFSEARKSVGDQELNLSKDTVLLKYVLEPADVNEVSSFELHVTGTERQVEMQLLDTNQELLQKTVGVLGHATLMYVPLAQRAEDTWTLFINIKAPDAEVAERERELAQSAAQEEEAEIGAAIRCHWELVVRSRTAYPIMIDTRRQDMAVELKTQWEDADKGRAERAKLARETYLAPPTEAAEGDEVPDDPHKAIPGKLPTKVNFVEQSEAKILTPELRAEQLELVQKSEEEFNQQQSGKVELRGAAATKWSEGNEARIGAWEEVKAGVETCYNEKLKDPRVTLGDSFAQ